jgi:tetratricopeptide (TPR) repeat protein
VAIALCHKEIASNGRSANSCQKLLGQLYLQLGDYAKAEVVYRDVLEVRQLDWAQVGMARVKKLQGDLLSAHQWLEEVIANNPLTMKAYDLQAEIYRNQEDHLHLQEVLEKAVGISPLSILRQQHLGDVAIINNDALTAVNAYRRAIKLGENSCYDQLGTHTGFAKASLVLAQEDKIQGKAFVRDALKVLANIEQRFGTTADQKIEAALIEAQLFANQGESKKANELMTSVKETLAANEAPLHFDLELELLKGLQATGQKIAADELLQNLLEHYKHSERELERLDLLLEEPVSEKNRLRVAAINKQGIASYEAGNFGDAVRCFESALKAFPNHVGIRLNLVQALVDKIKETRSKQDYELAEKTLARVAELLTPIHDQQPRYRQLLDMLRGCEVNKLID